MRRPPGRPRKTPAPEAPPPPPLVYDVGGHEVCLRRIGPSWTVAVDGCALPFRFEHAADAWAAGVGEADRLGPAGLRAVAS